MIKLAIIGLGYWGPNFIRIITENPNTELLWCCDISEKNLAEIKSRYKNVKVTTNLKDILKDPDVDAVIIAVPASKHFEVAKKVLLAGKDVMVEKPLAVSIKDAKELIKIARQEKRMLMVDHIFLFHPAIRKIKELIDKNEIGKIYYGHGTYTALGPIRIDVSAMWDLAIHFLYTISYLIGKVPVSISAFGKGYLIKSNPDVAFLNIEFENDVIFNLKVSWLDPVKTRSLVLVGDKGMINFEDSQSDKVIIFDRGIQTDPDNLAINNQYRFTFRYGDIVLPHVPNNEPLKVAVESFLESIISRCPQVVSPQDSVNSVILLEAAEYSLKHKGVKVRLKRNGDNELISFK